MLTNTSQTTQIKLSLPVRLQELIQDKADQYGLTMPAYVRHLIIADVKNMEMPVFPMSAETEEVAVHALKDHKQGKTHPIEDVHRFTMKLSYSDHFLKRLRKRLAKNPQL